MNIAPNTVKICSLRQVAHAEYVHAAGADLFGLIFAEARRQVTPVVAREVVEESRRLSTGLGAVGVFVDHSPEEINQIADTVGLDLVQLQRMELFAHGGRIERPVLLAIRTSPATTVESVTATVAALEATGSTLAGLVVDGFVPGEYGGAGVSADWTVARQIAERYPTLLAGGLHPGNVADGISRVRPFGVDVSSGVETDGEKDRAKIIAFVREARAAMANPSVGRMDGVPLGQSA